MLKIINLFKNKTILCPICKNATESYLPLADFYKENAEKNGYIHFGQGEMTSIETYSCQICSSSDRERLYAYWLNEKLSNSRNISMIHFAPENTLSKWLLNNFTLKYETADLMMEGVDHKVDMLKMPFKDNSYDSFICSHVLEHVEDDRLAISELYRILKPNGWGILMAPICTAIEYTFEDKSHITEEDRWKHYGQNDHVRLYSHNGYVDAISSSGFKVNQLGIEYFSKKVFNQLGLKETSILYIVEK